MRNKIKNAIITTCCAFTVIILYFIIFPDIFVPALEKNIIAKSFLICCLCGGIAILCEELPCKRTGMSITISFLCIWLTVFGVGTFVLNLIPLELPVIFMVTLITMFIYFLCYILMYSQNQSDAKKINDALRRRKDKI